MSVLVSRLVLVVLLLQGGAGGVGGQTDGAGGSHLAFTAGQSGGVWRDVVPAGGLKTLPQTVYATRGGPLLLLCDLGTLQQPLHRPPAPHHHDYQGAAGSHSPPSSYDDYYTADGAAAGNQYYDYYYSDQGTGDDGGKHNKGPANGHRNNNVINNNNPASSTATSTSSSVLLVPSSSSSSLSLPPPPPLPPIPSSSSLDGEGGGRPTSSVTTSPPQPRTVTTSPAPPTTSPFSAATVTWLKDDMEVRDRRHITTAAGHLNITKVVHRRGSRVSDEGEYRCVVHTAIGNISGPPIRLKVANLSRNFRVGASSVASGEPTVEGTAARLSCAVESSPPAHLTWLKDGQPVELEGNSRLLNPAPGMLQILQLLSSDAGQYRCVAHNDLANKTRSSVPVSLSVVPADQLSPQQSRQLRTPVFLSPYTRQHIVSLGDTIVIECLASGLPLPSLEWHYAKAVGDTWHRLEEGPNVVFEGHGNLRLSGITKEHQGVYSCGMTGTTDKQETELLLNVAPTIQDPPKNLVTLLAKTSRLNCSVAGQPPPKVLWYKNGKPVTKNGRIQMKSNQLIFANSVTADSALYQCVAINAAGYASSWAHMLVNSSSDRLEPPRDLSYKLLSSTSVLLQWSPVNNPNHLIVAYTLYISEIGSITEHQDVVRNTSRVLKDLKLNTNYSVTIRAFSEVASDPSEPIIIRTGEEIPVGAPDMRLTVVSPTELLVKWNPLPPELARGTITGYKVQWKKRNMHYYNVKETSTNVLEMNLTDLQPGSKYSVRVLAGNSVGYPEGGHMSWKTVRLADSEFGAGPHEEEAVQVGGGVWQGGKGSGEPHRTPAPLPNPVPLPPVVNLSVYWVGLNGTAGLEDHGSWGIKVTWQPAEVDVSKLEGYSLRYRKENQDWPPYISLPAANTSYIIAGLGPGWYQVEVRGFNLEGDSDPTLETVQTHERNPTHVPVMPNIEQLEVEVQSQTSVQLWWKVADHHKKLVNFYTVQYVAIPQVAHESARIVHSMVNEVVITGLKPFTWYEFSVRAHISEEVYGPFCPVVEAATTDRVPAAPTHLSFQPMDASTVQVSWKKPAPSATVAGQRPSNPSMWELLYTQNRTLALPLWTRLTVHSEDTNAKVSGLVSNTEYWFRVRGCSEDDRCGASSEPLPVTIRAWLHHRGQSHQNTTPTPYPDLLYALVGTLCILVTAALIICCLMRARTSDRRAHHYANGSGDGPHMNGFRYRAGCGRAGGSSSSPSHHEMEVYIPMLTQIPPEFSSGPLDAKGACTDHRTVNGFTNPRCSRLAGSPEQDYQPAPHPEHSLTHVEHTEHSPNPEHSVTHVEHTEHSPHSEHSLTHVEHTEHSPHPEHSGAVHVFLAEHTPDTEQDQTEAEHHSSPKQQHPDSEQHQLNTKGIRFDGEPLALGPYSGPSSSHGEFEPIILSVDVSKQRLFNTSPTHRTDISPIARRHSAIKEKAPAYYTAVPTEASKHAPHAYDENNVDERGSGEITPHGRTSEPSALNQFSQQLSPAHSYDGSDPLHMVGAIPRAHERNTEDPNEQCLQSVVGAERERRKGRLYSPHGKESPKQLQVNAPADCRGLSPEILDCEPPVLSPSAGLADTSYSPLTVPVVRSPADTSRQPSSERRTQRPANTSPHTLPASLSYSPVDTSHPPLPASLPCSPTDSSHSHLPASLSCSPADTPHLPFPTSLPCSTTNTLHCPLPASALCSPADPLRPSLVASLSSSPADLSHSSLPASRSSSPADLPTSLSSCPADSYHPSLLASLSDSPADTSHLHLPASLSNSPAVTSHPSLPASLSSSPADTSHLPLSASLSSSPSDTLHPSLLTSLSSSLADSLHPPLPASLMSSPADTVQRPPRVPWRGNTVTSPCSDGDGVEDSSSSSGSSTGSSSSDSRSSTASNLSQRWHRLPVDVEENSACDNVVRIPTDSGFDRGSLERDMDTNETKETNSLEKKQQPCYGNRNINGLAFANLCHENNSMNNSVFEGSPPRKFVNGISKFAHQIKSSGDRLVDDSTVPSGNNNSSPRVECLTFKSDQLLSTGEVVAATSS